MPGEKKDKKMNKDVTTQVQSLMSNSVETLHESYKCIDEKYNCVVSIGQYH